MTWQKELNIPLGGEEHLGPAVHEERWVASAAAGACTCTQMETLHVAGTRRVFPCIIIQSAFVIIAWANPAHRRVLSWAC